MHVASHGHDAKLCGDSAVTIAYRQSAALSSEHCTRMLQIAAPYPIIGLEVAVAVAMAGARQVAARTRPLRL